MTGNLPAGSDTSRAPWNQSPNADCKECGGHYGEDGHETITVVVDGEEREEPCPNSHMDAQDYADAQRAEKAEMKLDEMRLNGKR